MEQTTTTESLPVNPLMKRLNRTGTVFRLPSRGALYDSKDGVLADDIVDGEIEIFQMNTIDELHMRHIDQLYQGTAISKVFSNCIPSVKDPMKLFAFDVDYLLMALTVASYGNSMSIKWRCIDKECEHRGEYDIDLAAIMTSQTREIDQIEFKAKSELTLSNGQHLVLRPVKYEDHLSILREHVNLSRLLNIEPDEDIPEDMELVDEEGEAIQFMDSCVSQVAELFFVRITAGIESVDGHKNKKDIAEWVKDLGITLRAEITDKLEEMGEWGVDRSTVIHCEECGKEQSVESMINPVNFFTRPSHHATKKQ